MNVMTEQDEHIERDNDIKIDKGIELDKKIVTVRPEVPIDTVQRLPNYVGISEKTAGSAGISMNVVIIPASARAKPHYHKGFETAIYLLKGDVQTFYGDNLKESCINKQGDFIYIPAGVPHMPVNLSDVDDAIAIVSRNDSNEQESVREYSVKEENKVE